MALNTVSLRILEPYLRNAKILCLGYPDLLVTPEKIQSIFGVTVEKRTQRGQWHRGPNCPMLPETQELFDKLGSTIDCIDVVADYGIEKIVDLNYPHDLGQYDVVIDPGTIEHCFNIAQAIINAANAVKVGGRIFHLPPMTMLNHGFYNICPTMIYDFYTQNDWSVDFIAAFNHDGKVDIDVTQRFQGDAEASLYCLVKKTNANVLRYPVQSKYASKMEKLKNVA